MSIATGPSRPILSSPHAHPLCRSPYQVVCFDKLDYCSSLRNLEEVSHLPNYKFVKGNLLSADLIKYVIETESIDTIIHAAAQTHVDNSFGNSFAFTENNVMGTHVLAETAKICGAPRPAPAPRPRTHPRPRPARVPRPRTTPRLALSPGIKRFIHVSTDEVYGSSYEGEPQP